MTILKIGSASIASIKKFAAWLASRKYPGTISKTKYNQARTENKLLKQKTTLSAL